MVATYLSVHQSMSKCILISLLLFFTFKSLSQPRYIYESEKVIEGIYVLKPVISDYRWVTCNIVVIINDDDVVVVDSGLLPAAGDVAIKEIKKLTDKPVRYLINTHWHGDHWQGNGSFAKAYPGVEFITTAENFKMISRNGMVWAQQLYARYLNFYVNKYSEAIKTKSLDDKALSDSELVELEQGLNQLRMDLEEMKTLKPQLPTVTYSDQMTLREGDREIQLLYLGIGNTPGDAVIYLPNEKVLIPGDLIVYPSPFESGMFSPEWLQTSQKLAAIDYQYLIPGHGEVQKDHQYLDFLNALFAEIIQQTSNAYVNGTSQAEDIKAKVTHQSVVDVMNQNPDFAKFTQNLDPGFVPSALDTSIRRIIQGKQLDFKK